MVELANIRFLPFGAARRPFGAASQQHEIETMEAELAAMLVDLEARAKYGKIEGVAVPLLVHAKSVNDQIRNRLAAGSADTRARLGPKFARLNGQLRTVALALAELCRGGAGAHRA